MIWKYSIIVLMVLLSSCDPTQNDDNISIRLYGDALDDIGYSIAPTDDGYVIGGHFTEVFREGNIIRADSSKKKLAIIRTDLNGKLVWNQSFGGNAEASGSKVIVLSDGSFVSTGYIVDPGTNQKDVYVVKVSADKSNSMERIYPENGNQSGIDIIQTQEGFMILGSTDIGRSATVDSAGNASGKRDIYLLRINNNLELIGTPKAWGYWGNDDPVAIKNDINGGYVIVGTTDNSWPDQALHNIFILKAGTNGECDEGIRIIGNTDDEYASDIEVLENEYLIAGTVGGEGTDQSVYMAKVPEDLFSTVTVIPKFRVSSATFTASSFSVKAICRYDTESFVMAGQAGTGASAKMLIFVTDGEGNQINGKEIITTASGVQVAYDVICDDNENIVVVGKNSFENNSMISLFKVRF